MKANSIGVNLDEKSLAGEIQPSTPNAKVQIQAPQPTIPTVENEFHRGYYSWLNSNSFQLNIGNKQIHLVNTLIFEHLWFLWFLCWMVLFFWVVSFPISLCFGRLNEDTLCVVKKISLFILIFAPLLPLCLMNAKLGPDTSCGIIPPPHLLFYYLIFFSFGVIYYDLNDSEHKLIRYWYILFPFALFFLFPIVIVLINSPQFNLPLQTLFVWSMSVGMIGIFHAFIRKENSLIRYLSDSSYWLYIAHLPLVIELQVMVKDWPLNAFLKFLLINIASIILLLISYHLLVRSTWIGWLLNSRMKPWFSKTSTTVK